MFSRGNGNNNTHPGDDGRQNMNNEKCPTICSINDRHQFDEPRSSCDIAAMPSASPPPSWQQASDNVEMCTKSSNSNQTMMLPSSYNDFSESTSTLTVNRDAAISSEGELFVPSINYEVNTRMNFILCMFL